MSKRQPNDVSASVKSRLLNIARESGEEFNLLLIRYGIERLLYRLSKSGYADSFVLKGAILFRFRTDAPHRPTRDVDLLSRGSSDVFRMEEIFREVLRTAVINDGLHSCAARGSKRLITSAYGVRLHLIVCYAAFFTMNREQIFAEKYHAYTRPRGENIENSRSRDLVDMVLLIKEGRLHREKTMNALNKTFQRRKTHPLGMKAGQPPIFWAQPFSAQATECGLTEDLSQAYEVLARFIGTLHQPIAQ